MEKKEQVEWERPLKGDFEREDEADRQTKEEFEFDLGCDWHREQQEKNLDDSPNSVDIDWFDQHVFYSVSNPSVCLSVCRSRREQREKSNVSFICGH